MSATEPKRAEVGEITTGQQTPLMRRTGGEKPKYID